MFKGNTAIFKHCQPLCELLDQHSSVSTLNHTTFFSVISYLCEAEFWWLLDRKQISVKINVEQGNESGGIQSYSNVWEVCGAQDAHIYFSK